MLYFLLGLLCGAFIGWHVDEPDWSELWDKIKNFPTKK